MLQDRKGFTLIELLIVVVIIGILAAIAIPKFSATREKAYFSAMKSDLKNLQAQQELYYADHAYTYAPAATTADLDFASSQGVTVTVAGANQTGWSATAAHDALAASQLCAVQVGDADAGLAWLTTPGLVACTGE